MENTYCHEGHCESIDEKTSDKIIIIGIYVLFAVVLTVAVLSSASIGIYMDPMSLN